MQSLAESLHVKQLSCAAMMTCVCTCAMPVSKAPAKPGGSRFLCHMSQMAYSQTPRSDKKIAQHKDNSHAPLLSSRHRPHDGNYCSSHRPASPASMYWMHRIAGAMTTNERNAAVGHSPATTPRRSTSALYLRQPQSSPQGRPLPHCRPPLIQSWAHRRRLDTDLSSVVAPLDAMLTAASTAWEAARRRALRATSSTSSALPPGSCPLWCAYSASCFRI